MASFNVAIILSAASHWTLTGGEQYPCGFWPEELAAPHKVFADSGLTTILATPAGQPATPDDAGYCGPGDPWRTYVDQLGPQLRAPTSIDSLSATDIDAVFIPGGYAPMQDLATHTPLGELLDHLNALSRPIAAVCHGPVALLSAGTADSWPFAGRHLTCFSNAEEREVGIYDTAPWLGETALRERGSTYSAAPPWQSHTVSDGNLHTGQNPASAKPLAHITVRALQETRVATS